MLSCISKRVCPSVRRSIGRSIGRLLGRSLGKPVGDTFVNNNVNRYFEQCKIINFIVGIQSLHTVSSHLYERV